MVIKRVPIYHLFVEQAKRLDPCYLVMVTPSRWFSGGMGLTKFSEFYAHRDRRMRKIVDYPKLYEGFPGVKIRGGISYFFWDRSHSGPCQIQTMWDGKPTGPALPRFLDAYDILVRRNEAISILEKVRAKWGTNARPPGLQPEALRTDRPISKSKPTSVGMHSLRVAVRQPAYCVG